jgi:glycosyltransferase involved in cell wall biosynthesis
MMDMNALRTRMARWSCNHAHLALFTQAGYRDTLCTSNKANAHVTPAVWVNAADILDDDSARIAWEAKMAGPVKLLFAGRLVALKGVDVLLASLRSLEARGIRAYVDIIGQGEARAACVQAASELQSIRISVLDPVPYGRPFFELVRKYHAVLVPSLSDEQPRIVFDAYSQSVPVIASATDGLRPHIDKGRTGWLVPVGDVEALASAIARADQVPSELRAMGRAALEASRRLTHKAMHRQRLQFLREHCG